MSAAKARIPDLDDLFDEIDDLEAIYPRVRSHFEQERLKLPCFFRRAYQAETLRQILYLRGMLQWRRNSKHRFIAALLLGHLHGESQRSNHYLSNQMPHTISTKPDYSLRYWRDGDLWAPRRDVFELLRDRADFRVEDSLPERMGRVALGDARRASSVFSDYKAQVAAVVTSPPYLDVTNFEEDQWLRLWFLGGPPRPSYRRMSHDDRYRGKANYWQFLKEAWQGIASLLRHSAVIVCRIGSRGLKIDEVVENLGNTILAALPNAELIADPVVSSLRNRQTAILHPKSVGCRYELDFSFMVA